MTGRIIVADDHPLFREGMLSILQRLLLPLQPSPRLEGLTERQLDVLRLLAQGKSNKEIGRALDISHYTVRGGGEVPGAAGAGGCGVAPWARRGCAEAPGLF